MLNQEQNNNVFGEKLIFAEPVILQTATCTQGPSYFRNMEKLMGKHVMEMLVDLKCTCTCTMYMCSENLAFCLLPRPHWGGW